jgi:hypothetical protein
VAKAKVEAQVKDLQRRLEKQFGILTSKSAMQKLGDWTTLDIQKRIRLGYGVRKSLGKKIALKTLKKHTPEYTAQRIRNKNELDSTTAPKKQNLTYTGQLVRDLRVLKASKSNFTIGHSTKSRQNSNLTNRKLSGYVQDVGRPYMNITDLEFKRLTRFYQNKIIRPVLSKI